uniref:Diuretic hormone 31 n=1 Tax=Carcinus maenas TaxID=6759 RepID=A0A345BTT0_CARMA|nr:diuretic hormone 31 [Carcinus maenas]
MNNLGVVFVTLVATVVLLSSVNASPLNREPSRAVVEIDDPDYVLELLTRFSNSIIRAKELEKFVRSSSGTKRGLDMGLGRGFSGSQAAKHLMGLAAANYAGGPGRRKRDSQATTLDLHHDDQHLAQHEHAAAAVAAAGLPQHSSR